MAVTLLFKRTRARIGSLELDASLSEEHVGEVDVTEHPVETGANIADHSRPKLETLTIEGLVSDTPMPAENAATVSRTSFGVSFDSRSELVPTRSSSAYEDLRAFKDGAELLTVVTGLRTYENMKLTSLRVPRDASSSSTLRFTATFKEIRTVESQTVTVTDAKAKKKKSLGTKTPPPATEAQKSKSVLKSGSDRVGGIIAGTKKFDSYLQGLLR